MAEAIQTTEIQAVQAAQVARPANMGMAVTPGFLSFEGFNLIQRMAKMFNTSSLVPDHFRGENHFGDCVIALNMAQRLNADPLMVMQNLYGDILSDLCSGLVGGLGVVPSSNMGADHAMFEAVHGSAPDIAGQRIANPTAFLWSACLMLDHLGEKDCADRIRNAIDQVLNEGKHLTRDLHGNAGMDEYVDAICEKL